MTGAQYELINAILGAPGGAVVDRRNRAWILGANRSASFEAAQKRGWLRLAEEADAAGQRAIEVTDAGRAAARRYADTNLRTSA